MKFASVCSGIGAPEVAWSQLRWEPQWFSEIAKFPSQVLAHHYPQVPNHGSLDGLSTRNVCSPVDVIVGGTPCQSFSIAGLRGGLADSRGNLALEFCRLVGALRPSWFVWENVPGVLSSNGGRDFGSILGAMAELGYGLAWRILDARYCGVPQRRRRVFVVGSLAGAAAAGAVLFEPESVRRHSAPRKEAREDVAGTLGGGSGSRGWAPDTDRMTFVPEIAGPVLARQDPNQLDAAAHVIHVPSYARTLTTSATRLDSETETFVAASFDPTQVTSPSPRFEGHTTSDFLSTGVRADRPQGVGMLSCHADVRRRAATVRGPEGEDGTGRGTPIVVNARQDPLTYGDNCGPLDTDGSTYAVQQSWRVRRLTPVECERLQGFPDGYTDIPKASDAGRYAALGNSMAVPVMRWIGQRIELVHDLLKIGEKDT